MFDSYLKLKSFKLLLIHCQATIISVIHCHQMSNNVEIWSEKKYRYYFSNLNFFSLFLSFLQIKEMFGAGTACVVSPVNRILFEGQVRLDIHIIYVKSMSNLSTT